MGADQSLLQFVEVREELSSDEKFGWTLHEAHEKNGGGVSAFVYGKGLSKSREKEEFVENVVRTLKLMRHPTIVKFLAAGRKSSNYMLVTERVKPLNSVLKTLSSTEICAGLYNLIEALVFLHDKAGISHNNLSTRSVYVSEDGVWKLGGMECAVSVNMPRPEFTSKCREYADKECIPPEEKSPSLSPAPSHARDAYGLGKIASQLLPELDEFGPLIDGFQTKIMELYLNADPQQRPPIRELLQDRLFKNDYVEIVTFLKMITVKSAEEKERFFSPNKPIPAGSPIAAGWIHRHDLPGDHLSRKEVMIRKLDFTIKSRGGVVEKLYYLPDDLVASRLVPLLLSRFVLLDDAAGRHLLPHLLTPYRGDQCEYSETGVNPVLPEKAFRQYIIPELYKIFHVRDGAVRLVLLQYFPLYVHMFDKETLRTVILPQLLLGIRDLNDKIVELSLRAVADLVPILGGNILVGGPRMKYFAEGRPKFARDAENPHHHHHHGNHHVGHHGGHHGNRDQTMNGGAGSPRHQRHKRKDRKLNRGPREEPEPTSPTISNYNGDISSTENLDRLGRPDRRLKPDDVIIADDDVTQEMDKDWLDWNAESRIQDNSSVANILIGSDSEEYTPTPPVEPANQMEPLPMPVVDWSDAPPPSTNQNSSPSLLGQSASSAAASNSVSTSKNTLKLKSSQSAMSAKTDQSNDTNSKSPAKKPNSNKKAGDLGSEFEIKAIEIKKKDEEPEFDDFFADMQPNFPKRVDLLSSLAPSTSRSTDSRTESSQSQPRDEPNTKSESESSPAPSRLLEYRESAEAEGWGDEFVDFNDWDLEPESNISLSLPESVHCELNGNPQANQQPGLPVDRTESEMELRRDSSEMRQNEGDGISLTEDDQMGQSDRTESDRPLTLATVSLSVSSDERRESSAEAERMRSESDSFLPESERSGDNDDVTPTELKSEVDQWLNETPEDGR